MFFRLVRKQLCYMLGRQQIAFYVEDEDLRNIMFNIHVNDHFLSLAREVNILIA